MADTAMPADAADEKPRRSTALDPSVQARLGRHLREHYSSLVDEPIPDDLMRLLDQLDRKDPKNG